MNILPKSDNLDVRKVFEKLKDIRVRSPYVKLMLTLFADGYKLKDILDTKTQDIIDITNGRKDVEDIPWVLDHQLLVTDYVTSSEGRYRIRTYFFSNNTKENSTNNGKLGQIECLKELVTALARRGKPQIISLEDLKLISQCDEKMDNFSTMRKSLEEIAKTFLNLEDSIKDSEKKIIIGNHRDRIHNISPSVAYSTTSGSSLKNENIATKQ